ncbi:hypothetical protein J7L05_00155 [bacterium]|nr:hypothetical protein [bacterium]
MIKYPLYLLLVMVLLMMPSTRICSAQAITRADSIYIEDTSQFCVNQATTFESFATNLLMYQKATGVLPESIYEFVQSGFPMFWPMDLSQGKTAYVVDKLPEFPKEHNLGAFNYSIDDYGIARLDYVNFDGELLEDTGEEITVINRFEIFPTLSDSPVEMNPDEYYTKYLSDLDSLCALKGTKKIEDVDDYNDRVVYAFTLQLGNYLYSKIKSCYSDKNEFPKSFSELINEAGSSEFIIVENFDYFAELLQNADAKFLCGFDSSAKTMYIYLEIDGETYISHFENLDEISVNDVISESSIEDFDVTNPLLTTDNLSEIELPYDYVISIYDVPAGS